MASLVIPTGLSRAKMAKHRGGSSRLLLRVASMLTMSLILRAAAASAAAAASTTQHAPASQPSRPVQLAMVSAVNGSARGLKAGCWRGGQSISTGSGDGIFAAALRRDLGSKWAPVPTRGRQSDRGRQGAGSLSCVCAIPPLNISPLGWDAGMGVACLAASIAWVKLCTGLANRSVIKPQVSRKVIHATAAPLFMLLWPFFTASPSARIFASGVPLAQAVRLTAAGLSGEKKYEDGSDNELVKGISRSGRASETLEGPLKYALVLMALTAVEWRASVVGVVAILQLAVGDGFADLVGRRFGRHKWRKGGQKSIEGTAAFAVSAFASSMALIGWYHMFGILAVTPVAVAGRVAGISVACAAVELAPADVVGDDNVIVPVTAMVLGRLLFAPESPVS